MADNMLIKIKDLHVERAGKPVLNGIDLDMAPGDRAVLLGPNGSGKTTLLRTVIGKLNALKGEIIFQGTDITKMRTALRARLGIGYLDQVDGCFPRLSVEENLSLSLESIPKEERAKKRDDVFQLFPYLAERLRLPAGLLSGGERQSLSLALQIIRPNKLLLMDEPFAGIAPEIAKGLIDTLKELSSTGVSILAAEQNIALATAFTDKAYLMRDGKMIPYEHEKKGGAGAG